MKPLVLAHRGASAYAPENTLAAFNLAFEIGADGIELDVTLTKDGIPVVIHDDTVDRTTDGHGLIKQMTLEQVERLDAGGWFNERFRGERIPTLEQVLVGVGTRGVVNIELKTAALRPWPVKISAVPRSKLAQLSLGVLARLIQTDGLESVVVQVIGQTHAAERVLISCFNPLSLSRARSLNPRLSRGLLYASYLPIFLSRAWLRPMARPHALHPNFSMVTPKYVAWARRKHYRINPWVVDDPSETKRLIALGVDSIMTNKPDVLRHVVDSFGDIPSLRWEED
jgi:glycerophosphoryl diester phosphodiesterase